MPKQILEVLPDTFAIHTLDVDSDIPASVLKCDVYFIGKTYDELSIVVPEHTQIQAEESEGDWRVLEVLGPLNLSMVGIMADIGSVLAASKVSIFVVSTFETDYFLVKSVNLDKAIKALRKADYKVNK